MRFCMLSHPLSDWIIEEQKTKTTPRHLALDMSQNASSDPNEPEWICCRTGGLCLLGEWWTGFNGLLRLMSSLHGVMAQWLPQCQNTICSGSSWCWKSLLTSWESTPNHWAASLFENLQRPHSRHTRRLWQGRSSTRRKKNAHSISELFSGVDSLRNVAFLIFKRSWLMPSIHFSRCDGNLKRDSTPYKVRLKKAHSHAEPKSLQHLTWKQSFHEIVLDLS